MNAARGTKVAIYARVSTADQTTDNQLIVLREEAERAGYVIAGEYVDHGFSGGNDKRPALTRLKTDARKHKFSLVMAWALDRLGRSVQDLATMGGEFDRLGVDLYLHNQNIDTSTAAGKLFFYILAAIAEFERSLKSERIKAGIARARVTGTRSGKPIGQAKISPEREEEIREHLRQGIGIKRTARMVGVGVSTVMRVKREMQENGDELFTL